MFSALTDITNINKNIIFVSSSGRTQDRVPDLVRVRMQHDHSRCRTSRPRQGQHLVQESPEEDLRSGQLQDGPRSGGVPREVDGLDDRKAVWSLRPAAPASLPAHHTTRAPPDAEGGVQGGPEGGLPPGARQPAQGEAADAAQVVYEEGGQLEANLLGDLPPTDDSKR